MMIRTHQAHVFGRRQSGLGHPESHWLMDAAVRANEDGREGSRIGTEWALIDRRGSDPGVYLIRQWTDAAGTPHGIERHPSRRCGGAIGLLTLRSDCASVGPCPRGVDEGAGLLLMGFASMLAIPLPDHSTPGLEADWLVIMSGRTNAFSDAEVDRIVLLTHAVLSDSTSFEQSEFFASPRCSLLSRATASGFRSPTAVSAPHA